MLTEMPSASPPTYTTVAVRIHNHQFQHFYYFHLNMKRCLRFICNLLFVPEMRSIIVALARGALLKRLSMLTITRVSPTASYNSQPFFESIPNSEYISFR